MMFRGLMILPIALIAAPVMAQEAAAPAGGAQAGAATPGERPAQSPTDSVASIVNSEFPAYDANNDGQLDKTEFARWMIALKDQEMKATGKTLAPAEVTAWADGAFTTADADKSAAISKPELISYLSAGAA